MKAYTRLDRPQFDLSPDAEGHPRVSAQVCLQASTPFTVHAYRI